MRLQKQEKILLVTIIILTGILLVYGWQVFWFLTDDAYISFRYVSNSILGHGYVWNPPPFKPVEGYTNFLWIVVLDIVWRVFGLEPPDSSNYISLMFSFFTIMLGLIIVCRLDWNQKLAKYRILFVFLTMFGVVTNRTFLAWTSSGLETAMFNFFVTLWLFSMVFWTAGTVRWCLGVSTAAACSYLTRPDGALFSAITVIIVFSGLLNLGISIPRKNMGALLPILLIPAHLIWRKHLYGEWLPNTYYAKVVEMWPESGIRYLLSFILENGFLLWIGVLTVLFLRWGRRAMSRGIQNVPGHESPGIRPVSGSKSEKSTLILVLAILTVSIHVLYYVVIVGGDHFEYRVFSHLVLLIFISFVWMLNRFQLKTSMAAGIMILFILLSYPLQWVHWAKTHNITSRKATHVMKIPIVDSFPGFLGWYAEKFDQIQFWLISHHVCMRHQEHKIYHIKRLETWPTREEGLKLPDEGFPVIQIYSVGVPAWVLPKMNIIDLWGLNDYVIARIPVKPGKYRAMAHDRTAPREYVQCFAPNVRNVPGKGIVISERKENILAADIIACEKEWYDIVKKGYTPPKHRQKGKAVPLK